MKKSRKKNEDETVADENNVIRELYEEKKNSIRKKRNKNIIYGCTMSVMGILLNLFSKNYVKVVLVGICLSITVIATLLLVIIYWMEEKELDKNHIE